MLHRNNTHKFTIVLNKKVPLEKRLNAFGHVDTSEAQLHQTHDTKENDLEYFAVGLFGPTDVVNGLTRKFSLFRAPSPNNEL